MTMYDDFSLSEYQNLLAEEKPQTVVYKALLYLWSEHQAW
jgi:hypothetical protein